MAALFTPPPFVAFATLLATLGVGGAVGPLPATPAVQPIDGSPEVVRGWPTLPGDVRDDARPAVAQGGNAAPVVRDPGRKEVAEEQLLTVGLEVHDPDNDPLRISVSGLPPGARWDEAARVVSFRPDFIQGGRTFRVQVTASDGQASTQASFEVAVTDTVRPPWPEVVSTEQHDGWKLVRLRQTTDTFLDSPGYAGRSFDAVLVVPDAASAQAPLPVQVRLHPFDAKPGPVQGSSREFRLYPADPMNSYWWGYAESLPGEQPPKSGAVQPYTARRVLHLLEWVLRTYPGADAERTWLHGGSMGAAGALSLGLLHARHFSFVRTIAGEPIPRLHRPSRVQTLSKLWGAPEQKLEGGPGIGVWDWLDLTRALEESPEARDQFLHLWHGKDDSIIFFGALVSPSPLTGRSSLDALQRAHVGHRVVWDEGGHTSGDPVLGEDWYGGWDLAGTMRRDRAFPAFTGAVNDRDPGEGKGNGKRTWDPESGFAGDVSVPGDTGWEGDLAGGINRPLRWDATRVAETPERLELPLRVEDGPGSAPPRAGYPTTGDKLDGTPPIRVDVTPRRTRAFRPLPGERVRWTFGGASGEVQAGSDGSVTVPGLSLTTEWTTLVLERAPLR